jgi:hypothetical protein
MLAPEAQIPLPLPPVIEGDKLRVLVARRVLLLVFPPEQIEGQIDAAVSAEFLIKVGIVRQGARLPIRLRPAKQSRFEVSIGEFRRERPADSRVRCASEIVIHGTPGDPAAVRDLPTR